MAELGTAFPGEGGIQPYLSYMYGDVWGYLAAWSWIVATMPATLAILSIVFVESIYSSIGINEPEPPITHKLMSVAVLVCVTILNSISTRTSTRLSSFFVAVKLLTISLLILAGLVVVGAYVGKGKDYGGEDWHKKNWFAPRDTRLRDGSWFDWTKVSLWESLGFYSTALYGALWAYSGWDKVSTPGNLSSGTKTDDSEGELRGCRTSKPKSPTSTIDQHSNTNHHTLLCRHQRGLLRPPPLVGGFVNRCRCSRKSSFAHLSSA